MRDLPTLAIVAALLAAASLAAPDAVAEERPPNCAFDDPARSKALRDAGEPVACAAIDWLAERPEHLTLPMPCGHVMHFRRVDVGVGHVLGQVEPLYGDPNAASSGAEKASVVAPWSDVLSGAFTVEAEAGAGYRAYYLGQYEVTLPQWHLYELGLFDEADRVYSADAPACAGHMAWMAEAGLRDGYGRPDLVLPATGLSWFEAVDFTRAYTTWLLGLDKALIASGRPPILPWEAGSSGFVRLPTEAEWEFAARDGDLSADAQNRRIHRVLRDGEAVEASLEEVAVTEGFAEFPVGGVGRLAPNLLGLHDMLGNAEEYVLDLFRATRPDGLHGQRGGAVLRGGAPVTPSASISLGYRREAALFGPDGARGEPTSGLRLAVSAPFFTHGLREGERFSYDQLSNTALEDALVESRRRLTGRDLQVSGIEELVARIENAAAPSPQEARDLLAKGLQLLEKSSAESATAARTALRQRFITGASMAILIERTGSNIDAALLQMDKLRDGIRANASMSDAAKEAQLARIDGIAETFEAREREIEEIYAGYLDNMATLAAEPDAELLAAVRIQTAERFDAPALERLAEAYALQASQLAEWRERGSRDDEIVTRWLYAIDKTRASRDEKRGN